MVSNTRWARAALGLVLVATPAAANVEAPGGAPTAAELMNPRPEAMAQVAREMGVLRPPQRTVVARGGGPRAFSSSQEVFRPRAAEHVARTPELNCTRVAGRGRRAVERRGVGPVAWDRSPRARSHMGWVEQRYCNNINQRVVVVDQEAEARTQSRVGSTAYTYPIFPFYRGFAPYYAWPRW